MSVPAAHPFPTVDRDNPWPGLAAFTEDLRGFFFGREKETEELVRLVRRQTLTVLFGQSGLGKSSLLQAGAFPRLREADFLPLYLRLDHGFEVARAFQPVSAEPTGGKARATLADQVKAALTTAIKDAGAEAPIPRAEESLWEYFHRKDIDIWSAKNRLLTPVLAFDQFEEIFTLGRADDTRRARGAAFLSELADLVENRAPAALREKFDAGELDPSRYSFDKPSCQVVLTLREDFLPDLEGLKNEMRSILTNRMRIRRLTGTQALEIVQKPAPRLLAEGVAERVVEFVAGVRGGSAERLLEMEVEPALLSVICRELNERRRALGQAQITTDLVTGNRREILTDFYERSVADLPPAMRAFVEDHLLTKSGFRDNFALETALEAPGVTRELIDTLVSRRLLRIEEHLGVPRVELAHDVLAEVVRASRDTRQQRLALEQARERERRTRQRFWIVRSIAAGLVVLLAGVSWVAWRAIRAEREQSRLRAEAEKAHEREAIQRQHAEAQAYAADMNLVQQTFAIDNLGHAQELLNRHRPQPRLSVAGSTAGVGSTPATGPATREVPTDLRGWEWRYLWQLCRSDATSSLGEATERIDFLAVSPDGAWLAHGNSSGGLSIWNLATHEETRLPAGDDIVEVAFSRRDPLLALAVNNLRQEQYCVRLWSGATREIVAELPMTKRCIGLAFSRDGKTLATLTAKDQLTFWRVADGTKLASYPTPTADHWRGNPFAATEDLSAVAYASDPYGSPENPPTIHVLDLTTGQERWAAKGINLSLTAFAFAPDGRTLASSWGVDLIELWDAMSGQSLGSLRGHRTHVGGLVFSPDGRTLASGSFDQTVRVWDLANLSHVPPSRVFRGHKNEVKSLALLPDNKTIVSGGKDGSICFWDTAAPQRASSHVIFPPGVANWCFAADGQTVMTVDVHGRVAQRRGTDFQDMQLLLELDANLARRTRFSNDGRLLAAGSTDGTVRVWNLDRHTVVHEITAPQKDVRPVAFLAAAGRLVLSSGDLFHEWDLTAGREVQSWSGASRIAWSAAFSRDERWGMTIDDRKGQLRDMAAGRATTFPLDISHVWDAGRAVALSSDGKLFAVGSEVGYFILGETANPQKRAGKLHQFTSACFSVAFSPDGRRLAVGSGSKSESVKLWDTAIRQELLNLATEGGQFSQMAFSDDGNLLGCRTWQGVLHIWRAPSWEEIEQAERKAAAKH